MGKWVRVIFFFVVLSTVAAPAFCAQKTYAIDTARSRLQFQLKTTWTHIDGVAQEFSGTVVLAEEGKTAVIKRGNITVEVGAMHTGNASRDRDMRGMLSFQDCPEIIYQITGWTSGGVKEGGQEQGMLHGHLIIRAVDRSLDIPATLEKKGATYYLSGATQVSLREYELEPPLLWELSHVHDKVTVRFHVTLRGAPKPHPEKPWAGVKGHK